MTTQLRAYDHGRSDGFRAVSNRFRAVTTALAGVAKELSDWRADIGGVELPLASSSDADTVVAAATRGWKSGERELIAYGPSAFAVHEGATVARVAMVGGVEPLDLPVWVPNQAEVVLNGAAELQLRGDPKRLLAAFIAFVQAVQPEWAYVGVDDRPSPPIPPFDDGTPVVGWLTYLSSKYPDPGTLKEPAVVHDIGIGKVLVAHSSKPSAEAIEALSDRLTEDKVLLSARELRSDSR